jgi:hypothetical protein
MTAIKVDFHINSIFSEYIYVDRKTKELSTCYECHPVIAVNTKDYICSECGIRLTKSYVDKYNQYWGYSGYDE